METLIEGKSLVNTIINTTTSKLNIISDRLIKKPESEYKIKPVPFND